jgi:hypothetical protein
MDVTISGTLFKITPAGVETVLHSFGGEGDSAFPRPGLVQGTNGNFYGITEGDDGGGANIFEISPAGAETSLYSFRPPRVAISIVQAPCFSSHLQVR